MEPAKVERLVMDYLNDVQKKRDSPNTVKFVFTVTVFTVYEKLFNQ